MGNPKIRDVRNESILSKTKKSMRMGNFFLPKYDFSVLTGDGTIVHIMEKSVFSLPPEGGAADCFSNEF